MKKTTKKLSVKKETLRGLDGSLLSRVNGGGYSKTNQGLNPCSGGKVCVVAAHKVEQ